MSAERIAQQCICCNSSNLARSSAVLMPFVARRVFGHEPVEVTEAWGMKDLKAGMAYTLCTSLQCQDCGALFLDYRFSDQEMAQLYQGYRDERYTRERQEYEPGYNAIREHYRLRAAYLDEVERWLEPQVAALPAVLDWGGDSGINTPFLGKSRLTHVYDISSVSPVETAEVVDLAQVRQHQYDLVTCCQVLEHVPFPQVVLEQIVSVLRDETLLYLEVPREKLISDNPGSKELAGLKRYWHEHINFFSEDSLYELVHRAGLEVLDVLRLDVEMGWRKGALIGLTARRTRQ